MPLVATRGAASAQGFGEFAQSAPPIYIEDVFQTWLYTGNGSTQTITNGIDLSGKGGMTWIKQRSATRDNLLFDTTRGATQRLFSNLTLAQSQDTQSLTAFNANGFSIGSDSGCNINGGTYASWTFREQPKFFDCVTYTGNGVAGRQIPHNLGSAVGCLIVKCTSAAEDWQVWHRTFTGSQRIRLNTTDAVDTAGGVVWNGTAPTSTVFTVGDNGVSNGSGRTYVAYLFAHDAGGFGLTGTDNVISCGSFTGNTTVNLGYEPQWVLMKASSTTGNWQIIDNMRKWVGTDAASGSAEGGAFLAPNLSQAESNTAYNTNITPTGFKVDGIAGTHIYIAIRRGPMKTPTTGTSVFSPNTATDTEGQGTVKTTNFPVDLQITKSTASSGQNWTVDRLRGVSTTPADTGPAVLITNSTDAESSGTFAITRAWNNTGFQISGAIGNSSQIYWNFRRAPGFFDEVCYRGTNANRTINHNLTVIPELIIVKDRSQAQDWQVYSAATGATNALRLNQTVASFAASTYWNNTPPTSSVFTVGTSSDVNSNGNNFVAYLFASCPGVSKVGSFTGTGATQVINCGFTGGARFVLIKATSTTGSWYVWDSARGIVAGNDPYLVLNTTAAEVTNTDWVDTAATGFELSNAGGNLANSNGVTYIFLAIA